MKIGTVIKKDCEMQRVSGFSDVHPADAILFFSFQNNIFYN